MSSLDITYTLRSGVFRHVYTHDNKIRRLLAVRIAGRAQMNVITGLAQPLLEQRSRQAVFLINHNLFHGKKKGTFGLIGAGATSRPRAAPRKARRPSISIQTAGYLCATSM